MSALDRLHQAEAAARKAYRHLLLEPTLAEAVDFAEAALRDLLAALDAARGEAGNLSATLTSSTPVALPMPAFRLTWRDGQYRVSKPNIGDTDCYTAEQVERLIRYAAPPAALAAPAETWPVGDGYPPELDYARAKRGDYTR